MKQWTFVPRWSLLVASETHDLHDQKRDHAEKDNTMTTTIVNITNYIPCAASYPIDDTRRKKRPIPSIPISSLFLQMR